MPMATAPILLKAQAVRSQGIPDIKARVKKLRRQGIVPGLRVVLVGKDPASVLYTDNKKAFIESLGGRCRIINLSEAVTEGAFLGLLEEATEDPLAHGVFVQFPLPPHLSRLDVASHIPARKDVDGLSPANTYKLLAGHREALLPCTPKGIVMLLGHYGIELEGKRACVIGRSRIVGRPLALLLINRNATVTLCHSRTRDMEEITRASDLIVTAIGQENFLGRQHIGDRAPVVVDVGINRGSDGKLCGDVDFEAVAPLTRAITPVPGGVGPMTVFALAQNLLQAAEARLEEYGDGDGP